MSERLHFVEAANARSRICGRFGVRDITFEPQDIMTYPEVRRECLETLNTALEHFARLTGMPEQAIGLGRSISIRLVEQIKHAKSSGTGSKLHYEQGMPVIVLAWEDRHIGLARRFAHQWACALNMTLETDSNKQSRELMKALVNALEWGAPGEVRKRTTHARRIDRLGAHGHQAVRNELLGTSFKAYLEDRSLRRDGLDTERMWQEVQLREDKAEPDNGWPCGRERDRAIGYWYMTCGSLRWHRDNVNVTEGASAIARSELERFRRERRHSDAEPLFAEVTREGIRAAQPGEGYALVYAEGDDAEANVIGVEGRRYEWWKDRIAKLCKENPECPQPQREHLVWLYSAVERHAVETAAYAGAQAVEVNWDAASGLDSGADEPWKVRWELNSTPDKQDTGHPDQLAGITIKKGENPLGLRLELYPLDMAFVALSSQVMRWTNSTTVALDHGSRVVVRWNAHRSDRRDRMRISVTEHLNGRKRWIIREPRPYHEILKTAWGSDRHR